MAKGFWVKTGANSIWKTTTGFYVKVSPSTWQSVNDAWIKVKQTGTDAWQKFWASATNPDTPIEILTSYDSSERLRLQGKNYHWTPTPSTLFYTFEYVDNDTSTTYTLTSSTSTSNPSTGSSITLPSSATYRTISKNAFDNEFTVGGLSTYKFKVTGTTSGGSVSVQVAEYTMRTPKAPTLTVEKLSTTSVRITIVANSQDDFYATNRYIVYTSDAVAGIIESGGGRGGYGAETYTKTVTLTGLTAGRAYDIYVAPFTGFAGSTTANATGYPGIEGYVSTQTDAPYTFAFGNNLYISTNGYIGLDSANTSDSVSSTSGRVLAVLPGDLFQDTTTSIWYWSNTSQFVIRWEGYHYGQPSNLRQYEVTFYSGQSYATVYAINVANTTEGTQAFLKDGVALTSYPSALTTGSGYNVNFDGSTSPVTMFGWTPKSKSVMKQVAGLTSGSQDIGYTSITTSTNQFQTPSLGAFNISSFVKGTVSGSAQGTIRYTTLTWGASSNATRYEIQYQGSNDNVNWTTVQSYAGSPYNTGTSETKAWATSGGDFSYYAYMRANVRASEDTGTAAYVYSNSGSYVDATGTAPGQPTFGTITKTGTTASIPFTVGTAGSNYLYSTIEYQYRSSAGSYPGTWSTSVINNGAGTISLTGLSSSTTYYIKIRTRNYDELYSPENETNFTTNAGLSSPTISSVTLDTSTNNWTVNYTGGSGPYYQIWYQLTSSNSVPTLVGTTASTPDASSSSSTSTSRVLTPSAGTAYYWWVRSANTLNGTGAGNVSDWSGPVTATPINTVAPTLSGTTKVGQTLTYAAGTWVNATSYDLRLYRGTANVATFETLAASSTSSSATYVIPSSDFTDPNNRKYYRTFAAGANGALSASLTAGTELGPLTNVVLYTITFDSKLGTAVSSLTQTTEGGSIAKPTDPTRTDYTFGGWTTTDGGTTVVTWPRTPTSNETLYAKWTATTVLPSAPTGLSVGRSVGSDYISTTLSPSASGNTTKTQNWSFGRNTTFTVYFTRGANATSSEMYYSTSVTTPASSTSANGGSSTSSSGSFSYVGSASTTSNNDYTVYFWVRSSTSTDNSAWTYAGSGIVDTPSYSAFEIRLYRTSLSSGVFTTATPSRNDLSYVWTGVSTSYSHVAQVRLTFDTTARSASS